MNTHLPPLDFFLGCSRIEMRPEQELVVKYEEWELMVLSNGIIGVSMLPLGDLSGSGEFIDDKVANFLF